MYSGIWCYGAMVCQRLLHGTAQRCHARVPGRPWHHGTWLGFCNGGMGWNLMNICWNEVNIYWGLADIYLNLTEIYWNIHWNLVDI